MLKETLTGMIAVMALFGFAWFMAWLGSRKESKGRCEEPGAMRGGDCGAGCGACILEKQIESR